MGTRIYANSENFCSKSGGTNGDVHGQGACGEILRGQSSALTQHVESSCLGALEGTHFHDGTAWRRKLVAVWKGQSAWGRKWVMSKKSKLDFVCKYFMSSLKIRLWTMPRCNFIWASSPPRDRHRTRVSTEPPAWHQSRVQNISRQAALSSKATESLTRKWIF